MRAGFTLAVVTLAAVTAVGAVTFGSSGSGTYTRPEAPAPVGVFRDGGLPQRDLLIETVLERELPSLIDVLWSGSSTEVDRSRWFATLRDQPAFTQHGDGLRDAWRGLIDSLERWWRTAGGASAAVTTELQARAGAVSDQLAALELGYYLDAALDHEGQERTARPGLVAYRIERVAFVRTNEERVRVLDARRLDPGGAGATMLGIKSDQELDDPIVVLDAVEAKVARELLPVLEGATFAIESTDRWRPRVPLARAAGAAIRRELTAALYDAAASPDRAELRTRALVVASVRRHEAQHRIDQGRRLGKAARLAPHTPERSVFGRRARYELSAYLSQLASDVWLPQLTLWNLARHGFRRDTTRTAEALVAAIVAEDLAAELGIAGGRPVVQGGRIDRDRLAELMMALGERTTVELRSAAAAAWAAEFGGRLTRVYDDRVVSPADTRTPPPHTPRPASHQ